MVEQLCSYDILLLRCRGVISRVELLLGFFFNIMVSAKDSAIAQMKVPSRSEVENDGIKDVLIDPLCFVR